jgi:branched-subunit amino acid transport protein
MFGPGTTGAAIDAFESRFTSAVGAHFMIAANGKEAYPISAAESLAFRALYRRRMERARWIRRGALLGLIPLLMVLGRIAEASPDSLRQAFRDASGLLILGLPLFGFIQHPITSDFTKVGIERRLKRRMTTRHAPAITPVATPLGRFAKRLLITGFAIEGALYVLHALGPREEFAAHMRVLYGLTSGNESLTARLTGNLSWVVLLSIVAAFTLQVVDRRRRRVAAARAKAEAAAGPDPRAAG